MVASDGHVVCVLPTPKHLQELRQNLLLLGIESHKRERIVAQCAAHFTLVDDATIEYQLALSRSAVVDLITMTPNYRHIPDPVRRTACLREPIMTTAGFNLLVFRRRRRC